MKTSRKEKNPNFGFQTIACQIGSVIRHYSDELDLILASLQGKHQRKKRIKTSVPRNNCLSNWSVILHCSDELELILTSLQGLYHEKE